MVGVTEILLLLSFLLLPTRSHSSSYPLCTGSTGAPFKLNTPLKFCTHEETLCCNSAEDLRLQKEFQAMNIPNSDCASIIKSILCSRCDQFSAHLFNNETGLTNNIPALCNSTDTMKKHQPTNGDATVFCTRVWDKCGNIPILNSPFFPSLKNKSSTSFDPNLPSKLTDHWQSNSSFCESFGKSSACFNGKMASFSNKEASNPPNGLCLEKTSNGSYINMVPHPDGSNRVFLSNQQGQIWLGTIPEMGSTEILGIDESNPFADLSDQVLFGTEFGVMGMAFHPNFARNGRFFVSFNCDKFQQPGCQGRCSCNTDVNCDPAKIDTDNGVEPCQYHSAIGEFTANSTASKNSLGRNANPVEVRRIFTIGLPYRGGHAGQILFGPADGYLYVMMGDGSRRDDPYNFAQNKKSLLGKILRLDIDSIPSAEVKRQRRWGNYSIPKDNPYIDDKELVPEIWAMGFRNPWRCSFDSGRPSYFLCGDCGQDQYEEIDLIKRGGNYGWRVYEGPYSFLPTNPPGGYTYINPIFPVIGYNHTTADRKNGSASITGGYFYRSSTDPCMSGRYLYTDLYNVDIWAATENSGKFTSDSIPWSCAHDSPIQTECSATATATATAKAGGSGTRTSRSPLGYVFSLAEDNRRDVYFLRSSGVYRVARPSRCNYKCFKEEHPSHLAPTLQKKAGGCFKFVYSILLLFLNHVL